ncbi:cis-trans isomerase [Seminavis robusta]|uniref:Peptidyl-prolyl cis-trans isomerase n=1 Tax=Seminavis robusta TaxID=568900 RepID=A0A9N8D7U4_9STRA|nr:cis-trans isomerase [Seminavis robusta]|eukprot:Sro28_g018900.1 cis-trans isomerase (249) ;mRNA; r:160022-160768
MANGSANLTQTSINSTQLNTMTLPIHVRVLQALLLVSLSLALSGPSFSRRDACSSILIAGTACTTLPIAPAHASYLDPEMAQVTKQVYLDVEFGEGSTKGRIVMGLFGDVMPRVTQNFVSLCQGNRYAGTTFYRVLSELTVQGGAIGDNSGKTGTSSFDGGKSFEPDNYDLKHSKEGLVSMVRSLDGSVDSRFFINIAQDAGWADDRYAVFGVVQQGMDLVHQMEKVKVKPPQNKPIDPIAIVASGVL